MLIANYTSKGIPYSDFDTLRLVEKWILEKRLTKNQLDICNENVLNAFRLAIIEDRLSLEDIRFQVEGEGCFSQCA